MIHLVEIWPLLGHFIEYIYVKIFVVLYPSIDNVTTDPSTVGSRFKKDLYLKIYLNKIYKIRLLF